MDKPDDDTLGYNNLLIPHTDPLWKTMPKDNNLVGTWLELASTAYAKRNLASAAIAETKQKLAKLKAISAASESGFFNSVFVSGSVSAFTHPFACFPYLVSS